MYTKLYKQCDDGRNLEFWYEPGRGCLCEQAPVKTLGSPGRRLWQACAWFPQDFSPLCLFSSLSTLCTLCRNNHSHEHLCCTLSSASSQVWGLSRVLGIVHCQFEIIISWLEYIVFTGAPGHPPKPVLPLFVVVVLPLECFCVGRFLPSAQYPKS